MTTAIKRRRGTTTQHSTFTGLEGEITVDTTKDTLVVHDGSTAGGFPLLREDLSNNTNVASISTTQTFTNKTINLSSNTLTGTIAQFNTALSDGDFATLAGTETFSNKTFSTDPTISSGTANGVAYLNGSKVLTTGSALTFDGTNLGVGVSSANGKLNVATSTGKGFEFYPDNSSGTNLVLNYDRTGGVYQNLAVRAATHQWLIDASEQMRLTSTGLGIGTSSPGAKLHVIGSARQQNVTDGTDTFKFLNAAGSTLADLYGYGTSYFTIQSGSNIPLIYNSLGASGYHRWQINSSDVMRLDSSGNLLVGTTTTFMGDQNTANGAAINPQGRISIAIDGANYGSLGYFNRRGSTDGSLFVFQRSGSSVGSISVTTSATSYATSSDYRLKENIQPMQGALATVAQLNPVTYTWKADGSDGQGFIAHELQAVVPDCVTGEKDAVDEEGKPVYQGVDTSFLVATLTKAIQELKAELDATNAEVAALKGV